MSENNETKCPVCNIVAKTDDQIYSAFGWRKMKDSRGRIKIRPQSLCRICRRNHKKNKLKIKHELITKKPAKFSQKGDLGDLNIEKFTNDWNSRMSLVDLARKHNLPYAEKAKSIGLKLGLKKQKNLTFFDKFLKDSQKTDELITMYTDESISISKITTHFGFSDNGYVSILIKKIGIPVRRGGAGSMEKFEESKNEFSKMWNDNVLKKIIEEKFEISGATVYLWRERLGLEPRSRGGVRPQSLAEKIELLLVENLGALTSKEIQKIFNITSLQLANSYNSEKIQRLSLSMHVTSRQNRKPTDYFGNYTGQSIVYLNGMGDSLILKLSKILQTGRMFENNLLKKGNYNFMISRLAESEKDIENRSQQLYGLIHFELNQNKLESIIESQLKEYPIKKKTTKPISKIKSNNLHTQEILNGIYTSKFFGNEFSVEDFLSKLYNSTLNEQLDLLEHLFAAMNFRVTRGDNEPFFDLKIESNCVYYVKSMIYTTINDTDLRIFSTNLGNNRGIIVTFQDFEESFRKKYSDRIILFTKDDIEKLLNSVSFLPVSKNSFSKIMYGENRRDLVSIDKLDFEKNQAYVTSLFKNENLVCAIGSLKQIFSFTEKKEKEEFIELIARLQKITTLETLFTLGDLKDTDLVYSQGKLFSGQKIKGIVSQTSVSIKVHKIGHLVGTELYPSGIGYCRTSLLSCTCLDWLDQSKEFNLCKHLISFIFFLWNFKSETIEQINEFNKEVENKNVENKNVEKRFTESLLDEIYFLIRVSPIIERFWIDNVEIPEHLDIETRRTTHLLIIFILEKFNSKSQVETIKELLNMTKKTEFFKNQNDFESIIKSIYKNLIQTIEQNTSLKKLIVKLNNTQKQRILNTFETFWEQLMFTHKQFF